MARARVGTRPVVFVRTGWMTYYRLDEEPNGPVGGGSFNLENIGSEAENFRPSRGRLRGYAEVSRAGGFNLKRTSDGSDDRREGVTVVLFATAPSGGQRMVGWYRNATCYATASDRPRLYGLYNFEALASDAVLLPLSERTFRSPKRTEGGFGTASVRYPRDERGAPAVDPWMDDALAWLDAYRGPTLLDGADPGVLPESDAAISRGQGRQMDPESKRAVELRAVAVAKAHFRDLGYTVHDVSGWASYDLHCVGPRGELRVEVKGSSEPAEHVMLTRNEVAMARRDDIPMALFVVSDIRVSGAPGKRRASGGVARCAMPWQLDDRDLEETQYRYRLPKKMKRVGARAARRSVPV